MPASQPPAPAAPSPLPAADALRPGLLLIGGGHPALAALRQALDAQGDYPVIAAGSASEALDAAAGRNLFAALLHPGDHPAKGHDEMERFASLGLPAPALLLLPKGMERLLAAPAGARSQFVARLPMDGLDIPALLRDLNLLRQVAASRACPCGPEMAQGDDLLARVVDQLADSVLLIDSANGRILHANPAAEVLFGRSTKELRGDHFGYPMVEGDCAEIEILCPRKKLKTAEMRLGTTLWRGREVWLATLRDISPRKGMERRLQEAMRAAEDANREKTDFLARMSHDIRTPMSGIIGMADLALAEGLPPRQRGHLELIKQSAESLLLILNDILDLTRIEAGKLELRCEPFGLRQGLEPTIKTVANQCRERGLAFEAAFNPDVPDRLLGDSGRLRRIIENLLGNAVKFTDKGGVTLRVEILDAPPEGGPASCMPVTRLAGGGERQPAWLRFVVTDSGIGISQEFQERIFEKFSQENMTGRPRGDGFGLGLGIVRHLTAVMGGGVSFESREGQGTTFRVDIPFPLAEQEATEAENGSAPVPALAPLDILLVEDNKVNQLFTSEMLTSHGHRIMVRENGKEALELLSRERFDLILMDIQMPVMDGMEATRRIRDPLGPALDHGVPIIALTAHAIKGDRERFLDEGMNDYVSKPVDFGRLFRSMAALLPGKVAAHGAAGAEPRATPMPTAEVIDKDWFDKMLATRKDFLRRMFEVFLREEPKRLEKTRQALRQGQMEDLRIMAHSMKGAAATLGAYGAREQAYALEKAARDNDQGAAAAALEALGAEMGKVLGFMQDFLNNG